VTFSFFIDKKDAIYLEDIVLREESDRSISSQTYYSEGIYMTCISGSYPIISIPKKGFSFRFYDNEDYDRFQKILIGFLDKTFLDDELQKLRNDLKKNREKRRSG